MRLTNTPSPIPNQPPNQPQQIKQASQTAPTEQTQQTQQTPTTPVIKKPQLKKTKTTLQTQKKAQLSSTHTQQQITQTIWKKGVVHTEHPPKLNMLKGHVTVEKAKHKEKAKDSEDESNKTLSKTNNTEETPKTHKTEQEPVHQQEQEKQLEQPKEQEKEKPKDQEQDKGGRGGQQGGGQQQQQHKQKEQETHESEGQQSKIEGSSKEKTRAEKWVETTGFKKITKPGDKDVINNISKAPLMGKNILSKYEKDHSTRDEMHSELFDSSNNSGVEETREHVFNEKTVFFTNEHTQNLNKINFVNGTAKTTLLKQYEDVAKKINIIKNQLKNPEIQQNPQAREGLQQQLQNLNEQQASFSKDVQLLSQANNRLSSLKQGGSSLEIVSTQNQIKKIEERLQSQMTSLTSDVDLINTKYSTSFKVGAKPYNRLIFVMSPQGEFYAMDQTKRDIQLPDGHTKIYEAKIHHTTMLDGQEVGGGGELRVGSQLKDLAVEVDVSKGFEHFHDDKHKANSAFSKAINTIHSNAEKGVERRFVESFKSENIKSINEQIQKLESQPDSPENQQKLIDLKSQRTELLDEKFLHPTPNSPISPLQKQYQTFKETNFTAFKQKVLPQILHNVMEAQFPKGQIEIISDQSGHYQPDMKYTGQAVRELEKKGVEIEKLTVNLGSKKENEKEIHIPATGLQGFTNLGQTETDLRNFNNEKQTMHSELLSKTKETPTIEPITPTKTSSNQFQTELGSPKEKILVEDYKGMEGLQALESDTSSNPVQTNTESTTDSPYLVTKKSTESTESIQTNQENETNEVEVETSTRVVEGYSETGNLSRSSKLEDSSDTEQPVNTQQTVKTTETPVNTDDGYNNVPPPPVNTDEDYQNVLPKPDNIDDSYNNVPPTTSETDHGYNNVPPTISDTDHGYNNVPPTTSETDHGYNNVPPTTSETDHGYNNVPPTTSETDHGYNNVPPTTSETDHGYNNVPPTTSTTDHGYNNVPPVNEKRTSAIQELETKLENKNQENLSSLKSQMTSDTETLKQTNLPTQNVKLADEVNTGKIISNQIATKTSNMPEVFGDKFGKIEKELRSAILPGTKKDLQEKALMLSSTMLQDREIPNEIKLSLVMCSDDQLREVFAKEIGNLRPDKYNNVSYNELSPNKQKLVDSMIQGFKISKSDSEAIERITSSSNIMVEKNLKQVLSNIPPNSDKNFSLTIKSKHDMMREIAVELGVVSQDTLKQSDQKDQDARDMSEVVLEPSWLKQLNPEQRQILGSMAEKMCTVLDKSLPNRASEKMVSFQVKGQDKPAPESIILNGKTYENPKLLGEGGLGLILEYTDKNTGESVVVKSLLKPEEHDVMVKEVVAHYHAMGKENGTGHPNLIPMRGVLRGDNEALYMVMDKADGGDLSTVAKSVNFATEHGLPYKAQVVLMQSFLQDALKGMQHLQSQNMMHLDIKSANFLLDKSGKVMVSDLGSGQRTTRIEGNDINIPTTYNPPEWMKEKTQKSDIYQLGYVMRQLTGTNDKERASISPIQGQVGAMHNLINAMMDPDPSKRPSIDAVLQHSFMQDIHNQEPKQVEELKQATVEYSLKIGKPVEKLTSAVLGLEHTIKIQENALSRIDSVKNPEAAKLKMNELQESYKKLEQAKIELDNFQKDPENKKLLDHILQLSSGLI